MTCNGSQNNLLLTEQLKNKYLCNSQLHGIESSNIANLVQSFFKQKTINIEVIYK